ncbi:hypothetical protein GCM10010399_81800 [Dactylosporangium fulvum]|uniref:DUF5666 domain-containing protein n=1 Tax=Dactylosporangium fulvum TaxID=53359 RepID=A0ABY5WAT2_9ACTN|nr:hypothetical protein [Dactylosporangium fulvum]UWP87172.1 hypothetical protein Dfulv_24200 [Dactylosporangium fulvum]
MTEDATYGAGPAPSAPPATAPGDGGPGGSRHSKLKVAIVAAVSGVIVVGGGVAVANAASTSGAVAQQGPGHGGDGPGGRGGRVERGGVKGALHGDFVVKDGSGKYVTQRLQSGAVTAVSSTSITAKSEDGHSTTFTVGTDTKVNHGSSTIGDVKVGDTVTVVGVVSGDTATATSIVDAALRTHKDGDPDKGPGKGGGRGPRGSASPSPSK